MRVKFAILVALAVTVAGPLAAQNTGYLSPPKHIADIMMAEPLPAVSVSPARDVIAMMSRITMPAIAEVSQPMLGLAGLRINPRTNGPHLSGGLTGLTLRTVATGAERKVVVPAGARLGGFSFSPDGRRFTFTNTRDTGIDLYIGDVASGKASLVSAALLNGLTGGCQWLDTGAALACGFVPAARGAAPAAPAVPSGPNVQENSGQSGPVRTYQDLLASAHDEALFEHYMQTQVALVDAATLRLTPVGRPILLQGLTVSPNGKYLVVRSVKRPFSRLLVSFEFPADVEVWSRAGEKVRRIADVPMGDTVPITGVIVGPRSYRWVPTEPATLLWAEALDKGDLKNKVPHRDRILTLRAPFAGEPFEVARTEYRFGGAAFTNKGTILLTENDRASRTTRTWVLNPSWGQPRKLWDRKQQDSYSHPGSPMLRPGKDTILQVGDSIYLNGAGASKDGDRPFLDRLNLATFQAERLFRSDEKLYESVVGLLTEDAKRVMTRAETRTQPANYFIRELPGETKTAVTAFKDPHPHITAAERIFVTYPRKDGVMLSGTIYLPPDSVKGQRMPMVVWAYPREFVDAAAASQVVGSPNRFTTVGGSSTSCCSRMAMRSSTAPRCPSSARGDRQRQLHRPARVERRSRDRQGGRARDRRPPPHRRRRPQLWRVHDREPARALGSLRRRRRPQRRLQPDADAIRVPGRNAAPSGRSRTSTPVCRRSIRAQDQRADAADPRRSRQQLGHVPDPVGAALHGAQGPRRDGSLRHAPARIAWLLRQGVQPARRRGNHQLAGQVCEERAAQIDDDLQPVNLSGAL